MRLPLALCAALSTALALSACDDPAPEPPEPPRPVRVTAAEPRAEGAAFSLAGTVRPQSESQLAFRIGGRVTERLVAVGDRVEAGQVLARLDRQNEENAWRAARAAVLAAQAQLTEAQSNEWRARELLQSGFGTRQRFDQAVQQLQSARSNLDAARAHFSVAEDRLGYTDLFADAPGVVTRRAVEQGEVVAAGQALFTLAREGGRDAVFAAPANLRDQVPANPLVAVELTGDAAVRAMGRVREVSPQADAVTGAFEVKVGLSNPPEGMRLGSTVTGRVTLAAAGGIELPAAALTRADGRPAVWVVNRADQTVALRPVELARHDSARVTVASGVERGDLVVTAGVQALRPGMKVRLLGE